MTGTAPTALPLLRVRGLEKKFATTDPPTRVLEGIDLDVRRGEFLAIMGASGSGKSTLLYSVSGMDRPTAGTVELDGDELTTLGDRTLSAIRLTRMGFVFQQARFLENLSVRDNVLLPALRAGKLGARQAEATVDGLLERFGIAHIAHHGVTEASGGQLQRASLARALATDPAIVFADEPTGALDSAMTREVLDALTDVHADGTTILLVTHDPVCAARAERLIRLRDGVIAAEREQGLWAPEDEGARERGVLDWLAHHDFRQQPGSGRGEVFDG
ncbi:ABC transporter ATP-binding protein [Brevibacterium album]|uniref:ABC transporter ATP-binding protein n=1 Tax=Brevibacterium album TaxID=417948 RepID=UPI0004120D22|nr:ABC transporter ATP-binding protein [Brevibacterium album]